MFRLFLLCMVTGCLAVASLDVAAAHPDARGDPEAGRRLYEHGVLASGQPLVGAAFGGVEIRSDYAACVRCHRRSGFGSYEGGYYIPPITQPYLFGGRQISRDDRFRALFMQAQTAEFRHQVRRVRDRPAYTAESLSRVLRHGIDPTGRELERLMPRYALGEQDLANLGAYLRTLSSEISPGVGEEFVELATVVHTDVSRARREAMIGTIESFVDWYNERTLGDIRLAGHSVYGSSLYTRYARLYRLSVWEIDGPPETWRAQLEEHYADRPVFALVSGQVEGPWRPVAEFCDSLGLPALFPITDLPHSVGPLGGYSVYFNNGRLLEAELMLDWLERSEPGEVVVAFEPDERNRIPAQHLASLASERRSGIRPKMVELGEGRALPGGDVLVVWTDSADVGQVRAWLERSGAGQVLLPSAALASLEQVDPELAGKLRFSFPYALDQDDYPERFRARAWMNTRGLDYEATDVQFRAWYAMLMFRDSFMHLLDHYHRDYLIEVLEHQIQGSPNPGLYPDMALAPQQRFASKSGYIVRLTADDQYRLQPLTGAIVP